MIQLELIRPNIKMSSNISKNLKTPGLYPKLAFCDELQPESPEKLERSERYEIIPIGNYLVMVLPSKYILSALFNLNITIKIRNDKNYIIKITSRGFSTLTK